METPRQILLRYAAAAEDRANLNYRLARGPQNRDPDSYGAQWSALHERIARKAANEAAALRAQAAAMNASQEGAA